MSEFKVPKGWKLVPVEPTREMIKAGAEAYSFDESNIYRAMLAAAPSPWVSVEERIPDFEEEVLILFKRSGHIENATFHPSPDGEGWIYCLFDGEMLNDQPSHWMPLPTPPEKSE